MSMKVEKIADSVELGEGPHWDDYHQALFFVSIHDHSIHKYDIATGNTTKTTLGGRVGFMIPVDGTTDQFVVGVERKFLVIQWDGRDGSPAKTLKELAEVDLGTTNRINDGKADPNGRIFAGTMGFNEDKNYAPEKGSLFRLDRSKITTLCDKIGIANGLSWDLKEKAFYYIDSLERKVRGYDYDVDTGDISNKRYVFDFKNHDIPEAGMPDGMTIDTDGNIWVAVFNGSCILKIDPRSGKLLQKVSMPAPQITSVTFGGPNMDILFVTSANIGVPEEKKQMSGCTFKVTGLGAKGHKNVNASHYYYFKY